jgi:phage gpG-like protein
MPIPAAGARSAGPGGVTIMLDPPLEFISQQVGRFRAGLEDFGPLWERFDKVMEQVEGDRFDTEGHGLWPALADSTLAGKLRLGYPAQILLRTGDLRESLVDPARASHKERFEMWWGTDVSYAQYHQEGTDRMPERQVIADPFAVEDRRKLEREQVTWINEVSALTFGRIRAA